MTTTDVTAKRDQIADLIIADAMKRDPKKVRDVAARERGKMAAGAKQALAEAYECADKLIAMHAAGKLF